MEALLLVSIIIGILSVVFLGFAFFGKSNRFMCYLIFCLCFCVSMFFMNEYADCKKIKDKDESYHELMNKMFGKITPEETVRVNEMYNKYSKNDVENEIAKTQRIYVRNHFSEITLYEVIQELNTKK